VDWFAVMIDDWILVFWAGDGGVMLSADGVQLVFFLGGDGFLTKNKKLLF
jgi:hypothetical protein